VRNASVELGGEVGEVAFVVPLDDFHDLVENREAIFDRLLAQFTERQFLDINLELDESLLEHVQVKNQLEELLQFFVQRRGSDLHHFTTVRLCRNRLLAQETKNKPSQIDA